MDFQQARDTIIGLGKDINARGWCPATSTNFSVLLRDGHVAITASGRHKGHLRPGDVLTIDRRGNPVHGRIYPSAETPLHLAIYEHVPDAGVVLHTHSAVVTVLTMELKHHQEISFRGFEIQKAFAGVDSHEETVRFPLFDNSQDMEDLAGRLGRLLQRNDPPGPGLFIRGHGLYTWGRDSAEAMRHLEALEFLSESRLLQERRP